MQISFSDPKGNPSEESRSFLTKAPFVSGKLRLQVAMPTCDLFNHLNKRITLLKQKIFDFWQGTNREWRDVLWRKSTIR